MRIFAYRLTLTKGGSDFDLPSSFLMDQSSRSTAKISSLNSLSGVELFYNHSSEQYKKKKSQFHDRIGRSIKETAATIEET